MYKFILSLSISAFLMFMPPNGNSQKIEIIGHVVDKSDRPISGAKVSWVYEPEEPSSDGLLTARTSLGDGFFGFATEWKSGKKIRVFVQASEGKCFSPISITDKRLRRLPNFTGILIAEYNPSVDLGNVKNILRFGRVHMSLENAPDILIEKIKKRLIYLRIKDSGGNIVNDSTINPAYSENPRKLEFCLPEGQWCLELYGETNPIIKIKPRKVNIDSQVSWINVDLLD